MKPVKTFLFLVCALAVIIAAHFILRAYGYDGFLRFEARQHPESIWGSESRNTWNESHETREIAGIQQQWEKDSLMMFYKRIFRLDPDLFHNPYLQNIPVTSFEYDTAGAGRILLNDFFAKLLILKNPKDEAILSAWYEKPDFWAEPLAGNRKHFIRILHYGDSQIENDRISGTIRRLIQKDFGGSGPGLLPLFQNSSGTIRLKKSGNWHTVKAEKNDRRGNYGIYTAYLAPPPINTVLPGKKEQGTLRIELPESLSENGRRLFLEAIVHTDVPLRNFRVEAAGSRLQPAPVLEAFSQKRYTFPIPTDERTVSLSLELSKNHNLYTLSVNDTVGICLDNLAMRGSAGSVFSVNNRRFLTDQLNLLNTGLILYQFGINALARENYGENDYGYYRMLMLKELSYIRTLMPGIPIIVIGIPDKPLSADLAVSNPDIDLIRNIQKEVAFQTGCVFWDLCQAMGGENAMGRWANAQPALVSHDMVHFTARGADLIGKLFYKSLLDAYRQFLLKERKDLMMQRAKQLLPA